MFVNRRDELDALERWWSAPGAHLGLLWGRRRVGKTALLERFSEGHRTVFHTGAARPVADELRLLSIAAAPHLSDGVRDLDQRPFADWDDALESLAVAATAERPLLLVLDEFPELARASPELPSLMRAVWDRVGGRTSLRILICGSAVRTMEALQRERAPLYGRFDVALLLHPFRPHQAAELMSRLTAADRALVWGIVGGTPLYLEWWDEEQSVRANLLRLVCTPGGSLLNEGSLVLATEGDPGDLGTLVLRAIAAGRTRFNEIEQAVRADPGRTLDRLVELRLVERMVPVTERASRTRRRTYRVADNLLAFWLGIVDRHRSAIERGLGRSVVDVMLAELDDHMGERWEAAVRAHLERLGAEGALGPDVVDVGRWWQDGPPVEIDAVVLAGRSREVVLVGEAKWARQVDGARLRRALEAKATVLPSVSAGVRYAVAAREEVRGGDPDLLVITAADVFAPTSRHTEGDGGR